jgi:anti-anti-sigma factor
MRAARIALLTANRAHFTYIAVRVTREATRLTVGGRLVRGVSSAEFLLDTLTRAAGLYTRVISIDLRDVYQIDAAGIGVLAHGCSIAKPADIRFELSGTPGFIRRLFEVCHLDELKRISRDHREGPYDTAA